MLDHAERMIWEACFLRHALDVVGAPISRHKRAKVARWAASMAKIAEQFTDAYEGDDMEDAEVD